MRNHRISDDNPMIHCLHPHRSRSLVVDCKPLTLDPVEIRPNGWVAKETEDNKTWYGLGGIRTRAYHHTGPVAKHWKEWMTATYTGTQTLSSELRQQVARETAELRRRARGDGCRESPDGKEVVCQCFGSLE
ncbi:hypothetical protein LBMAG53_17570 [Planctomycetota bacterium]|nr:hypothetical protein LBMAG53_17570 [Planctomycetota bacterium]